MLLHSSPDVWLQSIRPAAGTDGQPVQTAQVSTAKEGGSALTHSLCVWLARWPWDVVLGLLCLGSQRLASSSVSRCAGVRRVGVRAVHHAAGADAWSATSMRNVTGSGSHHPARASRQLLGRFLLSVVNVDGRQDVLACWLDPVPLCTQSEPVSAHWSTRFEG